MKRTYSIFLLLAGFHFGSILTIHGNHDDEKSDHYQVLGVEATASEDEIRKAYLKKAIKLHPDKNKDKKAAHKRWTQFQSSYEILKDSERRHEYDTQRQYHKIMQHLQKLLMAPLTLCNFFGCRE